MLVQALTEVKIEMLKNHDHLLLGEILEIHYFDPYQIKRLKSILSTIWTEIGILKIKSTADVT